MSENTDTTQDTKRTENDGAGSKNSGESPENADTRTADATDGAEGAEEAEERNALDDGPRGRKAGAERQATVFSPNLRVTDPAHQSMLRTLQESQLDVEALLHDALLETFRTELYEKYREALADAEKKQRRREMKAKQRKARGPRRKPGSGSPEDNGTGN